MAQSRQYMLCVPSTDPGAVSLFSSTPVSLLNFVVVHTDSFSLSLCLVIFNILSSSTERRKKNEMNK